MASKTLAWLRCALIPVLAGGIVVYPSTAHARTPGADVAPQVRAEIEDGGRTTFLVRVGGEPDLAGAARARGKERAARVLDIKRGHAERSQAGLRRLLRQRDADFTPYWIVNAVRVTGDAALLAAVVALPEVTQVLPDRRIPVPVAMPAGPRTGRAAGPASAGPSPAGNEWNVDSSGAPQVWSQLGVRGAGTVVANIDTGVQADHPALAASYRGRGAGTHDYHWFDPAGACPTAEPCDNNGHGTHTMGTMVGGGAPAVGLAPGARWIAAKGCESSYCSTSSLLAAGQWIVAPTDLGGGNPRPDLAPDVVNNSWGAAGLDPWYADVVRAWVAAGIFPAFAAGNNGPHCTTVGTPGGYELSYATAALDADGAVAEFSGRGPAADYQPKPNIAAPGVDIRSTVPGGGYATLSGTSMASPHTAAAVALLWSAKPALRGDIAATRELLDRTAIDADDTSCGGTAGRNNVYGEGRLDAYAMVLAAQRGAGTLAGTVTSDGAPVPGADVTVEGPVGRRVTTGPDGGFSVGVVPAGGYTVAAAAFGFRAADTTAEVAPDGAARAEVGLERLPHATLSGVVTTAHGAAGEVAVSLRGTPAAVRTDTDGRYRLQVPLGDYELDAEPVGACASGDTRTVAVRRDLVVDLELAERADGYGYTCGAPVEAYRQGDRRLELAGDDAVAAVSLPFAFPLYGTAYTRAWISTNGLISFAGPELGYLNTDLPAPGVPDAALYPFWDDLVVDDQASVHVMESADRYVVEWRDVSFFATPEQRLSISAAFTPDGTVTYRYRDVAPADRSAGASATIGLESADGVHGFAYSVDRKAVSDASGVTFRPPATARPATAPPASVPPGAVLPLAAGPGGG